MLTRLGRAIARDWEGERPRPAPYDHLVLHGGDNRWLMLGVLMVLTKCAAAVALLAMGALYGVLAYLVVITACILAVEVAGGVRR